MSLYPGCLHVLAWIYLGSCLLCAAMMIIDEIRRPQQMVIMNFVWPLTALYGGPVSLWGYFRSAPKMTKRHLERMNHEVEREVEKERTFRLEQATPATERSPTREQVAVAATHCGAGCTLGDIAGEWWIFGTGLVIAGGELGTRLLLDFILAWVFGIVFQYFTIAPMRNLSFGRGVLQAMRADTLSIVAFQIGMSAWALLIYFVLFPNPHLKVNDAVFWFMMQIGMIVGFFASYPVNIFLIHTGWKEKMPQYRDGMKSSIRKQANRSR